VEGAEAAESDSREHEGEEDRARSRRRRRRRRRREEEPISASATRSEVVEEAAAATGELAPVAGRGGGEDGNGEEENGAGSRRRRGRRGGRRRARRESDFEPLFEEPRPLSDIVQILPTSDIAELGPRPIAGLASTTGEINGAEIEAARGTGPLVPDPVGAPGQMPREIEDLAMLPHHSVEATAGTGAGDPAKRELSATSETERTPEMAFSAGAPTAEPEHPVETGPERSSTPRRGWWQRLIQP
jgi:ribonuclease E